MYLAGPTVLLTGMTTVTDQPQRLTEPVAPDASEPAQRSWLARAGKIQGALVIGSVGLLIVGTVKALWLLPAVDQVVALRLAFLLVLCALPGIMWYAFLASRKASLLNVFFSNLERLGLLDQRGSEQPDARRRRVYTYVQRFEAMYGRVDDRVCRDLLQGRFRPDHTLPGLAQAARGSGFSPSVATATALVTLGWLITLPPTPESVNSALAHAPGIVTEPWLAALYPAQGPVAFAFLGAYFFSLQMLFRRYVLRDLRGSAYLAVSMRIVLAVVGTWVVMGALQAREVPSPELLALGFGIGFFPQIVVRFVAAVVKRLTRFAVEGEETRLPLIELDGLTVWHVARLQEEDIENMPNMATANLVELLLQTRFPPHRIVDWVDQAILYTHLGPESHKAREALRSCGIRTASALLKAAEDRDRNGGRLAFEGILGSGALRVLETTLTTNPNLALIQRWRAA